MSDGAPERLRDVVMNAQVNAAGGQDDASGRGQGGADRPARDRSAGRGRNGADGRGQDDPDGRPRDGAASRGTGRSPATSRKRSTARAGAPGRDDAPGTAEMHERLPAGMRDAVDDFARYLAAERNRSAHTVRAYVGDVVSLLDHAAAAGCAAPADLDITVLRGWLARRR